MSDENGKPLSLREVIEQATGGDTASDDSLLRDMMADYPALRMALLGGLRDGHRWPVSSLKVSRSGTDICVVLECGALEVERRTYSKSLFGALEILNTDLETQPGAWLPNWKGKERLQRKYLSE